MLLFRQRRGLIADQEEIDQRCTRSMFTLPPPRIPLPEEAIGSLFQEPRAGGEGFTANGILTGGWKQVFSP